MEKKTFIVTFVLGRMLQLFCVLIVVWFYVATAMSLTNTAENIKGIACYS